MATLSSKVGPVGGFYRFLFFPARRVGALDGGWNGWLAALPRRFRSLQDDPSHPEHGAAAVAMSRLKQQMEKDLLNAAVTAVVMAGTACGGARRTEQRALGKWRGSTLSGYLRNDEKSRKDAFRAFQTTGSTHW